MKKELLLILKYIRAAGISLLVIVVISALSMTGLTVSYGRIKKETEKYDKLAASGLDGCFYGTKVKPGADLTEKIRNVRGVTDVIRRPDTVGFTTDGTPDEAYSMALYNKLHYDISSLEMKGEGFDYNSDEPECIIACEQFSDRSIGDILTVNVALKGGKKTAVDFRIKGVLELPQSVLTMSGGGTSIDASLIFEDASFIIIKDNAYIRELIGEGIAKSRFEAVFISVDGNFTETESDELSKYISYQSVKQILDNTKAEVKTALSDFLPVMIFCVLYSALTITSLEILISYKTENELSVYRHLGMSRRRLAVTVGVTGAAVSLLSFALSVILTRLIYLIPDVSSVVINHKGLLLPVFILAAFEAVVSVLTLTLSVYAKTVGETHERI